MDARRFKRTDRHGRALAPVQLSGAENCGARPPLDASPGPRPEDVRPCCYPPRHHRLRQASSPAAPGVITGCARRHHRLRQASSLGFAYVKGWARYEP